MGRRPEVERALFWLELCPGGIYDDTDQARRHAGQIDGWIGLTEVVGSLRSLVDEPDE
jgi:hypothetical protein